MGGGATEHLEQWRDPIRAGTLNKQERFSGSESSLDLPSRSLGGAVAFLIKGCHFRGKPVTAARPRRFFTAFPLALLANHAEQLHDALYNGEYSVI